MVEGLQQNLLFDIAQHVGAPLRDLRRHVLVGAAFDAAENLLVGDAFFLGPFVDRKIDRQDPFDLFLEAGRVPLFRIGVFRHVLGDEIVDHIMPHIGDHLADHLIVHPFDALIEDDLALIVPHVVELQDVFADVEVCAPRRPSAAPSPEPC